jgi:hypothetical protein
MGTVNPVTEDDYEFDIGIVQQVSPAALHSDQYLPYSGSPSKKAGLSIFG